MFKDYKFFVSSVAILDVWRDSEQLEILNRWFGFKAYSLYIYRRSYLHKYRSKIVLQILLIYVSHI